MRCRILLSVGVAAAAGLLIPAAAHADPFWWCPKKACLPGPCSEFGYTPPAWRPWPGAVPEVLPAPGRASLPMPRPATDGGSGEPRELLPPPRVSEPSATTPPVKDDKENK